MTWYSILPLFWLIHVDTHDLNSYNNLPDFQEEYTLVWSDEFDIDGALDSEKWHHQTFAPNNGSWYNNEEQHYTDRLDNSVVKDGILKIIAKKETFNNGQSTKLYTSARLNSKFAFTYGKVEVRAKLPEGVGTWPAIWTLGKNISEVGGYWQTQGFGTTPWPQTGEIDIMEHWGDLPNIISAAVHTASSYGNTQNKASINVDDVSNAFHIYSIEWTNREIAFFVDDVKYYSYGPSNKNDNNWPFDEPQYLLLNVAMGGQFPGGATMIDPSFTESAMELDYVRVYQKEIEELRSDATLTDLKVNGSTITGFSSDQFDYNYILNDRRNVVPEVRFTLSDEAASAVIFNAAGVPGETTVKVTAEDRITIQNYTIEFEQSEIEIPLGLDGESVNIYPNPVDELLEIKLQSKKFSSSDLRIWDIKGLQYALAFDRMSDGLNVDVSSLAPGVYFIDLGPDFERLRFVKE